MQTHKTYLYYIGIDPGTETGICLWGKQEQKILELKSIKIHRAMEIVSGMQASYPQKYFVKVEDPRQATFGRVLEGFKAQGAGSVKRDASIWEDFLTDLGAHFIMVRPAKAFTKWKADKFKKITGWEKKTNQHARDAAMLVYGS